LKIQQETQAACRNNVVHQKECFYSNTGNYKYGISSSEYTKKTQKTSGFNFRGKKY
jgi:hypothetical protein